ncbi:MAG: ATP-binding cassette domain-containing protein, partial [Verrucomicrobiota bacterium]
MISCRQVTRTFVSGDRSIPAVQEVDLEVDSGEFLAITGASGSGKSTLLHLMGSLDTP